MNIQLASKEKEERNLKKYSCFIDLSCVVVNTQANFQALFLTLEASRNFHVYTLPENGVGYICLYGGPLS